MKRVSQMTALAMALGLACASSWAAELAKPLTLDQLQQQNGKAIDTRPSAFYNGLPQTLNGPSGHEPAALNLCQLARQNEHRTAQRVDQAT